jgi:hypothetical protein
VYFSVETYSHDIVPNECTTGQTNSGQSGNYPVAYIGVYQYGQLLSYNYYFDQYHKPLMFGPDSHFSGSQYTIFVQYEFLGSPAKDYTLKAYSKYKSKIYNSQYNTNMIHMDDQSPSGFTSSTYTGLDNFTCSTTETSTQ